MKPLLAWSSLHQHYDFSQLGALPLGCQDAVFGFWETDGCFYYPRQSKPPQMGRKGVKYLIIYQIWRCGEEVLCLRNSKGQNISDVWWPLKWGENQTGHYHLTGFCSSCSGYFRCADKCIFVHFLWTKNTPLVAHLIYTHRHLPPQHPQYEELHLNTHTLTHHL